MVHLPNRPENWHGQQGHYGCVHKKTSVFDIEIFKVGI